MKKIASYLIFICFAGLFIAATQKPVRILLAGDSTLADKPIPDNPERGWGMVLPSYFNSNVVIRNYARNGRSTRSFIDEGRWANLVAHIQKGDYVIIQFGHNDEKINTPRYASPATYAANLSRFVIDVRAKGGIPILCTPVMRRRFDAQGHFVDTHGAYPDSARAVARRMHVPLFDLSKQTEDLLISLGVESSRKLFLHIAPGQYKSLPNGRNDDTHSSELGAMQNARFVVDDIRSWHLEPLVRNLRPENKIMVTYTTPTLPK
ncbi:rhamnogalacturonan acetylesterase [Microbacter margulisiae]|uniref:Lysophospholipase L1-like esterase n=1 Tax=Microbacter margulisiae TaxID=1350067 RepID=A0A7W5DSJ8_9PORP|nr:rhamnogalacturonan acetylesterase [Microbacter margulisiae]MBB3187958.1 lysophospholipase L1-like esterase [Microbacter margulisiae]